MLYISYVFYDKGPFTKITGGEGFWGGAPRFPNLSDKATQILPIVWGGAPRFCQILIIKKVKEHK